MSVRSLAAELAALAAATLMVYGGVALVVASASDRGSASFGAAASAVVLSYGLARLLQRLDISDEALRLWGAGLSAALLYLILRIEIAGDPYLWELGWLPDLLSQPNETLAGHAGDVTEVLLLSVAWVWGIVRGSREFAFEAVLAEVSAGLVIVLLAAALASEAGAPAALRWLPVPYMVAGLLALSLAHLQGLDADKGRSFFRAWGVWTGGALAVIAALALLASTYDPPSFAAFGDAIALVLRGLATALVFVMSPFILAIAWVMQHAVDWLFDGQAFTPEPTDTSGLIEEAEDKQGEPAAWAGALAYALRAGLVALAVVVALAALWLAFRRLRRQDEELDELREEIESTGPLGDLRSLFAGAFGRLRPHRAGPTARDPIGRLYGAVLRRAAAQGLPRPEAATPHEFAARLEQHFASPVPTDISHAYAETRYGARPPRSAELELLRARWDELARGAT